MGTFRCATGYLLLAVVACSGGGQVESTEGGTKAVAAATGGAGQGGALVSGKTIDPICAPGATQACLGPGQCAGAQVCGVRGVSWGACGSAVAPTAIGSLTIAAGFATVGSLQGHAFTWSGEKSNVATCITPTCSTAGCTPALGTSAICAAGTVGADAKLNSVVGLGMNINQPSDAVGTLAINTGVTVNVAKGTAAGDSAARIMLTSGPFSWCIEAGSWTSGTLIPITSFNTTCWDLTLGNFAPPGLAIDAVHVVVPSTDKAARPYSICITNIRAS